MSHPSLLPPGSTAMEKALEQVAATLLNLLVPIRDIWSPERCPKKLLAWLAWALSVDKWDANWSEAQKRGAVGASLSVHRHKGTAGALKEAMAALGHDLSITEWHQLVPTREPYTFGIRVTVEQEGIPNAESFDTILDVANSAKNARSHSWGVDILGRTRSELHFAGASLCGEIVSILPEGPGRIALNQNVIVI